MVRITEELIRKKSEHNECIIGTLEELSLHQENVEKIENINNWCKNLKILYLQSNLISKIENLNKLKDLQYLNLAINNIEKIENLERCESLEKLDLTLNFIGDVESVCNLKDNIHLKHLYLNGNPCTDYEGYRNYVIAKLPQIECLDNVEIARSERIKALQIILESEQSIKVAQKKYNIFRNQQKQRLNYFDETIEDEEFWKAPSEHAPEVRLEIARRGRKHKNNDSKKEVIKKDIQLFNKEGRPLNINQAKVKFSINSDDPEFITLELYLYKYLDTSLIDVDLQPIVVRISVKGKIFQIVLPEEINVEKCTTQRSQTTGHLVIKMLKINYKKVLATKSNRNAVTSSRVLQKRQYLEVSDNKDMDFSKITEKNKMDIVDYNSDIPPLEYGN